MALKTKNSDQALIELFLDMLAAERGGAKNTLAAYARDLADFSRELGAAGRTIARASTDDLRSYLVSLGKRGFAAASVARRLSAIRQLYRFLYAEGRRADDPSAVIEGPKRGRGLPKVLSIAEVDRLLAAARSGIDKAEQPKLTRLRAARLACLIEVLYATGLRVSELVALPVSAAESSACMLTVRGKGNKERLVPLNDAAKAAMREYLALRSEAGEEQKGKWLFPSFGEAGHLTRQHFARELKTLAGVAGLRSAQVSSARAAPCVRQPSAAQRRRSARGTDAARPRRHLDDPDLYPRAGRTPQEPGARSAPAGGGMTKRSGMI